jgi:hypothetical protein
MSIQLEAISAYRQIWNNPERKDLEKIIAQDAICSFLYARDLLKARKLSPDLQIGLMIILKILSKVGL